jgi:hypothetical protein
MMLNFAIEFALNVNDLYLSAISAKMQTQQVGAGLAARNVLKSQ